MLCELSRPLAKFVNKIKPTNDGSAHEVHYQNRRGVNSNFFSSLILFSFLFIYHFWNDVSGHTSIWFVKMSRVLHSFLSLEKIFPPTLTFEQVRLAAIFAVASLE